jgi:cytochrome c-type biogenesis protein CcmH/NrfG
VIYLSFLRTLTIAAIVISIAASSVFSQIPTQSPNPALAPAVKLIRDGDFEKALKLLKRVVKENKSDGEAWYYLGMVYLQTSELAKAAEAFQKAVEVRPDLAAQAQGSYAYALVLRNRLDSAAVAANKALEIDPNNIEALYVLAIVDLRKDARKEAIKRADSIIALKPEFAAAYLLKSQAYVSYTAGVLYRNANKSKDEQLSSYKSAA